MRSSVVLVGAMLVGACEYSPAEGLDLDATQLATTLEPEDGPINEAISAYTTTQLACLYACGFVAASGCAAVSATCTTATVVTVGSVSIPCVVAVAATCGAFGGAGAVCGAYCVG